MIETVDKTGKFRTCSERVLNPPAIGYQKVAVKLAIGSAVRAITYTLERDYAVSHGTPLTGIVQ